VFVLRFFFFTFIISSLAFVCHEQGSTCIGFAPQHQVIVTGGRKGDICIFDVRGGSGSIKHRYLGHDSCLKCMTIDPHEQFYCTGAADGDIKVNLRALHSRCHRGENNIFNPAVIFLFRFGIYPPISWCTHSPPNTLVLVSSSTSVRASRSYKWTRRPGCSRVEQTVRWKSDSCRTGIINNGFWFEWLDLLQP